MQITVSGSFPIGSELPKFVEEKLSREVNKYFSTAIEANVTFTKQREVIHTNITINEGSKRGVVIKSNGDSFDIYSSFEVALERIAKQLKRYKERLKKYRRDISKNQNSEKLLAQNYYIAEEEVADYVDDDFIDDYIEDEKELQNQKDKLNIITEKQISIETLNVQEAIMKMNLINTPVLVFKNKDNGRVNVVYKRFDGNVSWIDVKVD